jgi:hypothetical protein
MADTVRYGELSPTEMRTSRRAEAPLPTARLKRTQVSEKLRFADRLLEDRRSSQR